MEEVDSSPAYSLSRKYKIKKTEDFKRLFESGKRIRTKNLIIYTADNSLGYPRLGISVAKKAVPKAVERNRIKRIVREAFRLNKTNFDKNDTVIIVTSDIHEKKLPYIEAEIKSALSRLCQKK